MMATKEINVKLEREGSNLRFFPSYIRRIPVIDKRPLTFSQPANYFLSKKREDAQHSCLFLHNKFVSLLKIVYL